MRYLNPFVLLNLHPDLVRRDAERLRREKKRGLAELELDGALGSISVTRSEFIESLAGLDDPVKFDAHAKLFADPDVLGFLHDGEEGIFSSERKHRILSRYEQREIEFIAPFLSQRLGEAFRLHLENFRFVSARRLVGLLYDLPREFRETGLRPVKSHFRSKIKRIEKKTEDARETLDIRHILSTKIELAETVRYYNPFCLSRRFERPTVFLSSYLGENELKLLNSFGDDFIEIRGDLVDALTHLSVIFHNLFDEYELAWLLGERALGLKQGVSSRTLAESNLRISRDCALSEQLQDCRSLIESLLEDLDDAMFDSAAAVSGHLFQILDIERINSFASPETNGEVVEVVELSIELAERVADIFGSKHEALRIIEYLLKIRLSDLEQTETLLKRLRTAYGYIDRGFS